MQESHPAATTAPAAKAPLAEASAPPAAAPARQHWPLGRAVAQIHGIYILAENAQGMVIVDMHAAHERIVYERLKTQVGHDHPHCQPALADPRHLCRHPARSGHGRGAQRHLGHLLGLEVVPFSPKTLAVRAVPAPLAQGDAVELARSVLAELHQHEASTLVARARHEILATMACHGAVRAHRAPDPR